MNHSQPCPCGSMLTFCDCCYPYISECANAPSPEALMRSRYSAYATQHYDYVANTYADNELTKTNNVKTCSAGSVSGTSEPHKNRVTATDIKSTSKDTIWCKLNVLSAFETSQKGEVEFIAYYQVEGRFFAMHELSRFSRINQKWLYKDGDALSKSGPVIQGRNERCLCGSGKKNKHCCSV